MELLTLLYLIASVSFILGLKMLSNPVTARKGNLIAAIGMALAIFGTIFLYNDDGVYLKNYAWIFSGLVIGAIIGTLTAKKVKMTAMPQMVSMFNGMGGACAALVSVIEYNHLIPTMGTQGVNTGHLVIILLGVTIGSISFAGSMIAWGKLNGNIKDHTFQGQQYFNLGLLLAIVVLIVYLAVSLNMQNTYIFYILLALALIYGVTFVMPIGGADMPVVISLLNSFTGVAAALGGFLYQNMAMLTGGILVGAAGALLTILMCKAMNRSLWNVLVGSFGESHKNGNMSTQTNQGTAKEISVSDAAVLMNYANKVMIVPGYGLAVAQAQHALHELETLLQNKGVEVEYAILPVAGRMPGHMNVLLAEADVPYEKLLEMEQANDQFPNTDVVLILGANDVVNPAAKTDTNSPIYGMPILDVETAKHIIVNKRSMKPGYAGIENELFFKPKTSMLFGDAKKAIQDLIAEIKNL